MLVGLRKGPLAILKCVLKREIETLRQSRSELSRIIMVSNFSQESCKYRDLNHTFSASHSWNRGLRMGT